MVGLEQIDTAEGVIVHKQNFYHYIPVCLSELNDLVKALEERRKTSLHTSQHHRPPAKQRTESSPSRMLPPAGAPAWTLDTTRH